MTLEPGEKKKARERMESGDGGSYESNKGRVQHIVADETGLGSYQTYRRLHKVMVAAGEGYEVVGENGYEVPTNVVEADDEKARLIALSENLERSDLTPVEEAKAFAEYVDVAVSKDDVEGLEEADVGVNKPKGERGQYTTNFEDYVGYIKGSDGTICTIRVPTEKSQSVKEASDKIPGVTPKQVQDRLELLLLPNSIQQAIDNETVTQSSVRPLVKFRKLGNVEQMHQEMNKMYEKHGDKDASTISSKVDRKISWCLSMVYPSISSTG